MVGGLSVPSNWTVAAPEIRSVAMVSPITTAGPAAAAPPVEAGSASSFNQMGLAGMAGQAMAGPPVADDSQDNGKPVTHARLAAALQARRATVRPKRRPRLGRSLPESRPRYARSPSTATRDG